MINKEQNFFVAFLSQISEIILQMRYDNKNISQNSSLSSASITGQESAAPNFGLRLGKNLYKLQKQIQQLFLNEKQNKNMLIEFFLQRKQDSSRILTEYWEFSFNSPILMKDSNNQLYKFNEAHLQKRLTVLQRSITQMLLLSPLWREYINPSLRAQQRTTSNDVNLPDTNSKINTNKNIYKTHILDYKLTFGLTQSQLNQQHCSFMCNESSQDLSPNNFSKECHKLCCFPTSLGDFSIKMYTLNNYQALMEQPLSPLYIELNKNSPPARERYLSDGIIDLQQQSGNGNQNPYDRRRHSNYSHLSTNDTNTGDSMSEQGKQQLKELSKFISPCGETGTQFRKNSGNSSGRSSLEQFPLITTRQNSLISLYSKKDDFTLVSTPQDIATKINENLNEFEFEFEMVIDEQKDENEFQVLEETYEKALKIIGALKNKVAHQIQVSQNQNKIENTTNTFLDDYDQLTKYFTNLMY